MESWIDGVITLMNVLLLWNTYVHYSKRHLKSVTKWFITYNKNTVIIKLKYYYYLFKNFVLMAKWCYMCWVFGIMMIYTQMLVY